MSKIKKEKAYAHKRIVSFGGVREGLAKNGEGASKIRNLRILSDGSMEKRNGWSTRWSFSKNIRGFWQGTVAQTRYIFLVAGNTVYRILDQDNISTLGTLTTSTGRVHFFRYRDRLYLLDGSAIRLFHPTSQRFRIARGYIPLYGHNWHPTHMGDIYEPANLVTQQLRIHYLNTTGVSKFSLPFFAASLDSVRVNNKVTTAYSFTSGSDYFTLSSAAVGDVVEIAMTIGGSHTMRAQLHGVTESFLHRENADETLFLYGAPQGYRVFCSSEVTDSMLTFCSVFYDDCDPLYFKSNKILLIGDTDHPVTALASNFDRILAFHTGGAHSISIDGDNFFSYPVLSDTGCSAIGAVTKIGNDIVVANERGICRLHATSSDPDNLSVQSLSEPLGKQWDRTLCKNATLFWDYTKQELWIRDAGESAEGLVWIWNANLNEWYCFDNIYAQFFSFCNDELLFATGSDLCVFEDQLYSDAGKAIDAYYQSGFLSFDSAYAAKRSLRAAFSVSTGGNDLVLKLKTERNSHIFAFEGKSRTAPEFFDVRISPGRFRFLRYEISCVGTNASKIHEANLFTTL